MAKASGKNSGSARIRFIMVEAELADGDIGQITQAIQNALRPSQTATQRIAMGPSANGRTSVLEATDVEPDFETDAEAETPEETSRVQRVRTGPRKPPATPDVLDIDLTTGTSLQEFAEQAKPKSHPKRFLVVAAWFKEHRGTDAITASHVYTCYRSLRWPTDISDFAAPLRSLKHDKLFSSPEKGRYAINHLGLQQVQEMISGSDG